MAEIPFCQSKHCQIFIKSQLCHKNDSRFVCPFFDVGLFFRLCRMIDFNSRIQKTRTDKFFELWNSENLRLKFKV